MAALVGYDLELNIDGNELEGLNSFTLSDDREMIDITNFKDIGSASNRKYLAGLEDGTLSLSGQYDGGTAQAALRTKKASGADVAVTIDLTGDSTDEYTFNAKVTNFTVSAEVGGEIQFSCELQLNGAIT